MNPVPFRRRNFFIKKAYQARFALYPLLFLCLFLIGAGLYLHGYLREFLEFELYLPHSRLENPWTEITPVLTRVALWGGGVFLLLLGGWVWRRFGVLRRDLNRLADWMADHARGDAPEEVPEFSDREVATLGRGLAAALARFQQWDARVAANCCELRTAGEDLAGVEPTSTPEMAARLTQIETQLRRLREEVERVRIDEELS